MQSGVAEAILKIDVCDLFARDNGSAFCVNTESLEQQLLRIILRRRKKLFVYESPEQHAKSATHRLPAAEIACFSLGDAPSTGSSGVATPLRDAMVLG